MSSNYIFPDVNITNIKLRAKERIPGGVYMLEKGDTEKLIHDVLSEIKKCVGHTSIHRSSIFVQLYDGGKLDERLYPNADILEVISFLNIGRGFNSYLVKKHLSNCKCDRDDAPCTTWLKIENTWD